jgi:hypothetical protein
MTGTVTLASLSPAGRDLVELMQRLNFGRVEGLVVRQGEPVLDPPPRIVREVKFCAENGPRPEVAKENFALKARVRELFNHMESIGNGGISRIEVKHGLPFRMILEENAA